MDIPERVGGAQVSSDFFKMTGRTAALGRTFTADDVRDARRVASRWAPRVAGSLCSFSRKACCSRSPAA